MSKKIFAAGSGEQLPHKTLWLCARIQLKAAKHSSDSWHFQLVAMLMGALTFEAYLNYVGEKLLPEVWKSERTFFGKKPNAGSLGKLRKLIGEFGGKQPDHRKRPFSSILTLIQLRDTVVHAKSHRNSFAVSLYEQAPTPTVRSWLEDMVTQKKAEEALDSLSTYLEKIHAVFRENSNGELTKHALKGGIASGCTWAGK